MQLSLDDDTIRGLVSEGIIAQLSGEQREKIIGEALSSILKPGPSSYGRTEPSPLQLAFNMAVNNVAQRIAVELIEEDPELRTRIKAQVLAGVENLLTNDSLKWALSNVLDAAVRKVD